MRCAACGEKIGFWDFKALLCAGCRTYSCDPCRSFNESECLVCGSTKAPKMPGALSVVVYSAIAIGLASAAYMGPDFIDEYTRETMPFTTVDDAVPGSLVKIQGTIASNSTVALDSAYNETHDHYRFIRHPLTLIDGMNGQCITLELLEETVIYEGRHPSTTGAEGETSYHSNDTVFALGIVYLNATGGKWLRTELLAPAGTSTSSGLLMVFPLIIFIVVPAMVLPILVYWLVLQRRNNAYIEKQGGFFKVPVPTEYRAAASTSTIENGSIPYLRRITLISAAVMVPLTVIVEGGMLYMFRFSIDLPSLTVLWIMPALALLVIGVVFRYLLEAPLGLLIDSGGFELRHRGGRTRGYRWSDIVHLLRPTILISTPSGNSPESIFVTFTNGQIRLIKQVSPEMAMALEKAWERQPRRTGQYNRRPTIHLLKTFVKYASGSTAAKISERIRELEAEGQTAPAKIMTELETF